MTKGIRYGDTPSYPQDRTLSSMEAPYCSTNTMHANQSRMKANPGAILDTPLERFGLQIRRRRRQAGYDPWEFAAMIDIEFEMLAALEFGVASLEDIENNIPKIADGLQLPETLFWKLLNKFYFTRPL